MNPSLTPKLDIVLVLWKVSLERKSRDFQPQNKNILRIVSLSVYLLAPTLMMDAPRYWMIARGIYSHLDAVEKTLNVVTEVNLMIWPTVKITLMPIYTLISEVDC